MPPKAAQGAAVDHDSEEKAKNVDKKKPDTKVGKAKAKASGKAKASPKPKAKAKAMKKNADAAAKKRPAASTGTLNQTIEELQQAAHGLNEKRDKGKALKYQRMKETGSLPQHIVHLVEEEAKRATSKRSFVTATINKLFTRNNDGTLALNLKDPMFVEAQNIYTKHFSKATQKALPQSIMIGLYFGNSLTAFQEAVKRGDVTEVDGEDGKTYYAFQSYEVGREDGKETVQTRTGKQQLTNQMAKELSKAFDAVGWNFRGKSAGDLVKEDGGLTEPTCQLLKQASESQVKLGREAATILKKLPANDEYVGPLRQGCAKSNILATQLNQVIELRCMPDGEPATSKSLESFLLEVAKHTKEYNLLVETAKGCVRANKK